MRKMSRRDIGNATWYTILGLPETATQYEIKRAYRRLIKETHPDRFPDSSPCRRLENEIRSIELNEAYSVLSDPVRRSSYDRKLAWNRQPQVPAPPRPLTTATTTSTSNQRPQLRARQKGRDKRLGRVMEFWMFCGTLMIAVAILIALFSDIFATLIDLLQL
jgi:curved DNA-binding protein CbpA